MSATMRPPNSVQTKHYPGQALAWIPYSLYRTFKGIFKQLSLAYATTVVGSIENRPPTPWL